MREKVSNRLKHIMKIRNLKQVDIINKSKPYQKKLGISLSKSTLSQYINDVQSPDQDRIYLLSKTLNVGEAWLMGYDVDSYRVPDEERQDETIMSKINNIFSQLTPPRQENVLNYANEQLEEQNKVTSIDGYKESKLVSYIACGATGAGIGEELYGDILHEEVFFKEDETPSNADFCILVNGDSMEPMLKQGTYAFIKKEDSIKDGTIALVVLDGVSLIKRVDICEDYINLVSLNPKYDDIKVASFSDIKVMGKVVL
ncbi:TPA: helix-turn-helix domain-containing protein [Staphylococcus aureus]|nr:helix-turn-helix domain-containing protein [Staphylococcus aureus]HDB3379317.1 helix-turn-helix domain-containing protein [Staphylococcus aureus]